MPRKLIVGGVMQRASKPGQVKKVPPPIAPELPNRNSVISGSSGYSSGSGGTDRNSFGTDDGFPLPPSPGELPPPLTPNKDFEAEPSPNYITKAGECPSPSRYTNAFFPNQQYNPQYTNRQTSYNTMICDSSQPYTNVYQPSSIEDQGIDVTSPGRDSPSSSGSSHSTTSSGCRNSSSSLDSGRASSSTYDGKLGYMPSSGLHRLSGPTYESNSSLRHSYHSSSSSLDRSDDAVSQINVPHMLNAGVPETEVLNTWLSDLHFEEYFNLFIQAGYDLHTISRMTPEDLTAIGITKPTHRKKLKAEIANLNISDGLPDYIPESLFEWLHVLRLDQYLDPLTLQGYDTVNKVTELTWEDLEEIGVKKLGHLKKLMLAIKRVKDLQRYATAPVADIQHYNVYPTIHHPPSHVMDNPNHYTHTYTPSNNEPTYVSLNSPQHVMYQPDLVPIQVRQSSSNRSAESLEETNKAGSPSSNTSQHQTFLTADSRIYETLGWRRSFDDGDITPTNEGLYEVEGGGTLPRPKASNKPRPVAKISAVKTRCDVINQDMEVLKPSNWGSNPDTIRLQQENAVNMIDPQSPRHILQHSALGDQCHSLPHSPRGSLLRNKKTPPPPPKRTNSMRSSEPPESVRALRENLEQNRTSERLVTDKNTTQVTEEVFAACVKNLTNKFSMSQQAVTSHSSPSHQLEINTSDPGLDYPGSDSPPPPAPGQRNESRSSFDSTSSAESNLPFANENVGTIKQRQQRLAPSLAVFDPTSGSSGRTGDPTGDNPDDRNLSRPHNTGDVLSDIGNMLADLTDELDAMLEDELMTS